LAIPLSSFSSWSVMWRSTSSASCPGPECDHVHLDVGHVGVGLDRQPDERHDPRDGQDQHHRERDEPLVQRERDETRDHGRSAPLAGSTWTTARRIVGAEGLVPPPSADW
jgi:hypothetical protein